MMIKFHDKDIDNVYDSDNIIMTLIITIIIIIIIIIKTISIMNNLNLHNAHIFVPALVWIFRG